MQRKPFGWGLLVLLFPTMGVFAEDSQNTTSRGLTTLPLKFGAFVDGYYNQNFNSPSNRERGFTTQAVRNQEFNINLAHVDTKWETDKTRGRLALQFGTSVNTNYSSEPTKDVSSNQLSVRNIQEGYVGVKLAPRLWMDAGIYFGHIGHESWISQKNHNYTRAFALDYVPYYSSGVRFTWEATNQLSLQFHIMNGWQNINENNKDKSLGMQVKYKWNPQWTFTANYFAGNEAPSQERKQNRFYQNLILEFKPDTKWTLAVSQDIGWQWQGQSFQYTPGFGAFTGVTDPYRETAGRAYRQWYQGNIWVSYLVLESLRIGARYDRMIDPEQIQARTNTPRGFDASAGVLTFDLLYWNPGMFRIEFVRRKSTDPVFDIREQKGRQETLVVFALSFLWDND